MNWADRIANYERVTGFPKALFESGDGRVIGLWVMGNDYRVKSQYYGGYPAGYLRRIKALFPDKTRVLHLFSGKVDTEAFPGVTVDINPANTPSIIDDCHTLSKVPLDNFDLVMADPAYSCEDSEHYGTPMIQRNTVMRVLGERLTTGCHVVWLDQVLPMYRKEDFAVEAYIGMVKSTNHRFRVITIFKKGDRSNEQTS